MAADLQEVGVDVAAISRQVYETVPLPKLRLLGIALCSTWSLSWAALVVTSWLREEDFAAAGADESHAEGSSTRSARSREPLSPCWPGRVRRGRAETKVSLRSMDGASGRGRHRGQKGGGGHKQAAGFTTDGDVSEVLHG